MLAYVHRLVWLQKYHDYWTSVDRAKVLRFAVEKVPGADLWSATVKGDPLGTFNTIEEAKKRCQETLESIIHDNQETF